MDLGGQALAVLTRDVMRQVLGCEVRAAIPAAGPDLTVMRAASVRLEGKAALEVAVVVTHSLARRLAGALFSLPEGETAPADLDDALGELASRIAGGIKASLAAPCQLGLPRSTVAAVDLFAGGVPLAMITLECLGEPLQVALTRKS